MNWGGIGEFFSMGGYGLYVWGSFGVTAALVVAEIWMLRVHRKEALREARRAVEFGKVRDVDENAA